MAAIIAKSKKGRSCKALYLLKVKSSKNSIIAIYYTSSPWHFVSCCFIFEEQPKKMNVQTSGFKSLVGNTITRFFAVCIHCCDFYCNYQYTYDMYAHAM